MEVIRMADSTTVVAAITDVDVITVVAGTTLLSNPIKKGGYYGLCF